MSAVNPRVPAAVAAGVICLVVGVGLGAVGMGYYGDKLKEKPKEEGEAAAAQEPAQNGPKMGPGGGPGGGKGGMGGMGGGKGGGKGGFGPNPKVQLARLVDKLDVLTKKSLHVQLSPEQKQQVQKILADVDSKDDLTDDEAKAKLDELLKVLEGQKDTLTAAGYQWPGGGGGGGPPTFPNPGAGPPVGANAPPQNPFKAGENGEKLKSLRATLGS